ncbi:MAG: tRNA dimethylallyltransferase, partial [Patescibacteria group bacterium]
NLAYKAIDDILKRGKTPIIVGGTGLYLQAVVDRYQLSTAKPDKKLRQELEKKTVGQLFLMLKKINSKFANKLHESDQKNKRRLIRYLEITDQTRMDTNGHENGTNGHEENTNGHENVTNGHERNINDLNYDYLIIGLTWPKEVLHKRIYQRLIERLEKEDMVGEVKRLYKEGVSYKRLESFGLEYKYIARYLQGKLDYDEMVEKLFIAIRQFSKRQISWFRRWEKQGRKIYWIKNKKEAEKLVKKFLK